MENTSEYKQGVVDFERGLKSSDNPFSENSKGYNRWLTGWMDAAMDNMSKLIARIK